MIAAVMTTCSNCDKQIDLAKQRMHQVQCLKLVIRCPQCNQAVLKSEIEQHRIELHTEKPLITN